MDPPCPPSSPACMEQALGKMSSEVGFCPAKWKHGLPSCCRNVSVLGSAEGSADCLGRAAGRSWNSAGRAIIFRPTSLNYDGESGAVGAWRSPTKTFAHVFSLCSLVFQRYGALNPTPRPAYYIFSVITVPSHSPTIFGARWVLSLISLGVWMCTAYAKPFVFCTWSSLRSLCWAAGWNGGSLKLARCLSVRQAPGDGSQRAAMPKIIGMVRARQRLFQINRATGGKDAELQKKLPELKAIKLLWLITCRGASADAPLTGSAPVILWEWGWDGGG